MPSVPRRSPRRARYLVPLGTPRRAEALAAAAAAAVAAGVLFAPATLILTAAFGVVGRISRWRPLWLSGPAACGIVWTLAIGPGAAVAGLRRGPAAAVGIMAAGPGALGRLPGAVARGLPGQFPLALTLAAAVAALAWWLRWLHTDEWDMPPARPGLVGGWRRWQATASLRAGRVLTRDGVCLGVDRSTGRAAALSWREAGGGVLVTGAAAPAVRATGLRLAHAAIRRRKPVIVVDPTGDRDLPGTLAALCAAARAPLVVFGAPDGLGAREVFGAADVFAAPDGPRYEPGLWPSGEQQAALAAVPWGPRPGSGTGGVTRLADVLRQRGVALFALGGPETGSAARVLTGLIAADVAALYAGLQRAGSAPDGLCWLTECEGADPSAVAGLIGAGSPTGLATVLASTAAEPAGRIAGQVNAAIVHRLADPGLATRLAPLTGTTIVPLSRVLGQPGPAGENGGPLSVAAAGHAAALGTMTAPVVQAGALCALSSGDFVLVTGLTGARAGDGAVTVLARCQAVSERMPGPPPTALPAARRPA